MDFIGGQTGNVGVVRNGATKVYEGLSTEFAARQQLRQQMAQMPTVPQPQVPPIGAGLPSTTSPSFLQYSQQVGPQAGPFARPRR